ESGVMLSSGDIANAVGPNMDDGITAINGTPGDPDLDVLAGVATFDAVILEFDFVPAGDTVSFNYVFSSDEYNENVGSSVNDSFGFFVNGVNCATVNGLPVSINTINNGNPYDTDPRSNPSFYINNDLSDGGGSLDTEMDGLTVVLTCNASVTPGSTNHIKLAIADGGDNALDSNVFLEAGSFTIPQPPQPIPEPLTMGLFGSGLAALGAYVHKRRKAGEKAA
ncbi:MAG: PEP-CTERM sorting domain-containing protein, partial [Chloroflexi bacterium]|nr:PEP-CTERM sorting domain-containing protein [Chloroflexota bacterium]